jgi:hypothetical protein
VRSVSDAREAAHYLLEYFAANPDQLRRCKKFLGAEDVREMLGTLREVATMGEE